MSSTIDPTSNLTDSLAAPQIDFNSDNNTKQTYKTADRPCRLLDLPAELRLLIFFFCLTLLDPLNIMIKPNTGTITLAANQGVQIATSVLATCKLFNAEATPILYGFNTISLHHPKNYIPVVLEALEAGAQYIKTVEIGHTTEDEVLALVDFLPKLSSLESVIIHPLACQFTNDPMRIVTRLGPFVKALHDRLKRQAGTTVMDMIKLPLVGDDRNWWKMVEEAMREMIDFLDAKTRNGGRTSNF